MLIDQPGTGEAGACTRMTLFIQLITVIPILQMKLRKVTQSAHSHVTPGGGRDGSLPYDDAFGASWHCPAFGAESDCICFLGPALATLSHVCLWYYISCYLWSDSSLSKPFLLFA